MSLIDLLQKMVDFGVYNITITNDDQAKTILFTFRKRTFDKVLENDVKVTHSLIALKKPELLQPDIDKAVEELVAAAKNY